ncbi:hypothetical protein AB4Z48_00190 [Cupriavidus sp. 2TAF22]|uniref:hypothetical protein n=1 Tax=unclassified Cupriavidus TaxID=2640874 RepID=UPI003F933213
MPIAAAVEPFPSKRFEQSAAAVVSDLTDSDLAAAVGRSTAGRAVPGAGQAVAGLLAGQPGQLQGLATGSGTAGATGGIAGQVAQATGNMSGALLRGLAPLAAGAHP